MKKVTSPKQAKVKRKKDSSRPNYVDGACKNIKPVRTKLPEVMGSSLDDFKIEQIKLE